MEVSTPGTIDAQDTRERLAELERSRQALLSVLEDMKEAETALRRRADEFAALYETASDLGGQHDLHPLLEKIARHAKGLLNAPVASIWIYDPVRGDIELASVIGQKAPKGTRLAMAEGMAGRVAQSRQPLIVEDYSTWEHRSPKFESIPIRAAVEVPMLSDGELIGVLTVNERGESTRTFCEADSRLLALFAALAAAAVHNARLLEQARTRAEQLAAGEQKLQQAYDDLRTAQDQIVQQERLRALGQMASGIAHDFNNVLSPILGYSEMLLDEDCSDDTRRRLELIHTSAQDAAAVVQRLQQFYRKQDPSDLDETIDLVEIVRQIPDLTRPKWRDEAQRSGRTIEIRLELDDVPSVRGDSSQLREVVTNLVFNAVDAMPRGGDITIRLRGSADSVVLEVADTGTGMTEDVRQRCFEPFFTTKSGSGTGLGLSVCHGIIERHGGGTEIDSVPGLGTTVRVFLPTCPDQVPLALETAASTLPRGRVLYIDDDPRVRTVVAAMLHNLGQDVDVAESGFVGLKMFRESSYDLVITDLGMPDVDGHAVTRIVKMVKPESPVVMLTGWGSLAAESVANANGPDLVIGKPLTSQKLREAMEKVWARMKGAPDNPQP